MYKSGVHVGHLTEEQAQRNAGLRRMPLFAADSKLSNKSEHACTKHKYSAGAVGPGLMVTFPATCMMKIVMTGLYSWYMYGAC